MKKILIAGAMLVLGASVASAAGVNLSWNDCGLAGQLNATFACNTNTGLPFPAIASYVPPAGVDQFLGLSAQIDITTDQPNLPDWWKHGTGQCRGTTGLTVSFDFTSGPFTCADVFGGQAAGGFAYDVGFGSPARARFRIQAAIPADTAVPIDPSTEYYAFKANFARGKTTGTGSCAGCTNSACIVLNEIQLFQPLEAGNDPQITNPADRDYVTWQAPPSGPAGCPLTTPTRSTTWGQVKSLYR